MSLTILTFSFIMSLCNRMRLGSRRRRFAKFALALILLRAKQLVWGGGSPNRPDALAEEGKSLSIFFTFTQSMDNF